MPIYQPKDKDYIKIPEFGVDQYNKRIWTVKVKKDNIWSGKRFYSYEEAYRYYIDQLISLRTQLNNQKIK